MLSLCPKPEQLDLGLKVDLVLLPHGIVDVLHDRDDGTSETTAPPTRYPLRPQASIMTAAEREPGFLKTEPQQGLPMGWDWLRRRRRSSTSRAMASWLPGVSRKVASSTISVAAAWRTSPLPGLRLTTSSMTAPTHSWRVPASIETAPPTVPGMPAQNSSPESERLMASETSFESGSAAPAVTRPSSAKLMRENSRPSVMTQPS